MPLFFYLLKELFLSYLYIYFKIIYHIYTMILNFLPP